MPAVRAHVDSNGARKGRLTSSARRTAGLEQAPVNVTDIDEGQPPDLAFVRLLAVIAPALRTPPAVSNENAPVPYPKEVEEGEVRQAIEIGLTGSGGQARQQHAESVRRR